MSSDEHFALRYFLENPDQPLVFPSSSSSSSSSHSSSSSPSSSSM